MSRPLPIRYSIVLIALLQCVWCATAAQESRPSAKPAVAPLAGALVSEWKGKIEVQLPGHKASSPVRGLALPAGTLLDTQNGLMVLTLQDESQVLLRPHTRLVLSAPGPGNWNYFQLLIGHIRAFIRKRTGGEPPFQLGTPSAVIAVRGTRFDVEVNRHGVTEVDVFEGLVEVSPKGVPGSPVLVKPGFSTRVAIGGVPEAPVQTDEIRPFASAPYPRMGEEFQREEAMSPDELNEGEIAEPSENESEPLEGDHAKEPSSPVPDNSPEPPQ